MLFYSAPSETITDHRLGLPEQAVLALWFISNVSWAAIDTISDSELPWIEEQVCLPVPYEWKIRIRCCFFQTARTVFIA
ncbi:MAG: hypothetical protein CSA33_02725 [Desulfobulbus propionicus]|nr:MAG: hypothetical protein CSA33_02725 [Desulfobulbus propionicus]